MTRTVRELRASFGHYSIIQEVVTEGIRCAEELHHVYLAEYHIYYGALRQAPRIELPPGKPWRELAAAKFYCLIEQTVAGDPAFPGKCFHATPSMWRTMYAIVADGTTRGQLDVRLSDVLLSPLARPKNPVYGFLRPAGLIPRQLIAPVVRAFAEPDQGLAQAYYEGLHDMLASLDRDSFSNGPSRE